MSSARQVAVLFPRAVWFTQWSMYFVLVGEIIEIEVIAAGPSLRALASLSRRYAGRRWRKLKGVALIRTAQDRIRRAELHWYEAHDVGRKRVKIKRFLD